MKKLLFITIFLIGAVLSIWAVREITSRDDAAATKNGHDAEILPGFVIADTRSPAPEATLLGPDGETSLAAYQGQVILINFWAEWCAPCREEMPTLAALDKALGGDAFRVLPISVDRALPEDAQQKLEEFGGTGLQTLTDQRMEVMGAFGVPGLPTTILLDRGGREIGRLVGPADWNSPEALSLIRAALRQY